MAVFYYDSEHAGAPQLYSSPAGAVTNILDACLVGTSGTAYGSTASLGWTLAYSATNERSYRMPTASSTGFYLYVQDTATIASAPVYFRGYETMTSVNAGSNPFPTVAQMTNGVIIDKGTQNTVNNRKWCLWSNGKFFHFFIDGSNEWVASDKIGSGKLISFGDINTSYPSDIYHCNIHGYTAAGNVDFNMQLTASALTAASYTARNHDGTSLSVATNYVGNFNAYSYTDLNNDLYNGSLLLSKVAAVDVIGSNRIFRGFIPGLYTIDNNYNSVVNNLKPMTAKSGDSFSALGLYLSEYMAIKHTGTW